MLSRSRNLRSPGPAVSKARRPAVSPLRWRGDRAYQNHSWRARRASVLDFLRQRGSPMPEYELYCFAQSGNAYRAALMLNLIGADWKPIRVDFFGQMVQRTPQYRADVNEMGEAPVLVHGSRKLTQSGVILTYLARRSGKFLP